MVADSDFIVADGDFIVVDGDLLVVTSGSFAKLMLTFTGDGTNSYFLPRKSRRGHGGRRSFVLLPITDN